VTTYNWKCRQCGYAGAVQHDRMSLTILIDLARAQHREKSPDCKIVDDNEAVIGKGRCEFAVPWHRDSAGKVQRHGC